MIFHPKRIAIIAVLIGAVAFLCFHFIKIEKRVEIEYCPFTISKTENFHMPLRQGNDKLAEVMRERYEDFWLDIADPVRLPRGELGYTVFIWHDKLYLLADCNIESILDFKLSGRSKKFSKDNLHLEKISDDEYAEAFQGSMYR